MLPAPQGMNQSFTGQSFYKLIPPPYAAYSGSPIPTMYSSFEIQQPAEATEDAAMWLHHSPEDFGVYVDVADDEEGHQSQREAEVHDMLAAPDVDDVPPSNAPTLSIINGYPAAQPKKKQRVKDACQQCHESKRRCQAEKPCRRCMRQGLECTPQPRKDCVPDVRSDGLVAE